MAVNFSQWGNDLYSGRRSYKVVPRYKLFISLALAVVAATVVILLTLGLKMGIEFVGGVEYRVSAIAGEVKEAPAEDAVTSVIGNAEAPKATKLGGSGVRIQTSTLSKSDAAKVREALAKAYDVPLDDVSQQEVGATWGSGVWNKALTGSIIFLFLVAIAMMIYFRNWAMSVSAIAALLHDLAITLAVYALVGFEITPASLIGFLTVLGYSMYDTVVVFDKVRENTAGVLDQSRYTYAEAANLAVNQTMVRSINTSVVALLPVASILFVGSFLLGAGTLRDISLALFVGMAAGTYSSIFLATPLEVFLRGLRGKISAHSVRVLDARALRAAAGETKAESMDALSRIGATRAGEHLGQAAQPVRKRRGGR